MRPVLLRQIPPTLLRLTVLSKFALQTLTADLKCILQPLGPGPAPNVDRGTAILGHRKVKALLLPGNPTVKLSGTVAILPYRTPTRPLLIGVENGATVPARGTFAILDTQSPVVQGPLLVAAFVPGRQTMSRQLPLNRLVRHRPRNPLRLQPGR